MPAKQPKDLHPDEYVKAIWTWAGKDTPIGELKVSIELRISQSTMRNQHKTSEEYEKLSRVIPTNQIPEEPEYSFIIIYMDSKYWMVANVQAVPGWGPFLYDIAMELATESGSALRPHDSNISDEALRIWDFYFNNRQDVEKRALPKNVKRFRHHKSSESTVYRYRKSPPSTLTELRRLDKWEEEERMCLPE
jgi:hypothetical protein